MLALTFILLQDDPQEVFRRYPEEAGWNASRYGELVKALILTGRKDPKYLDRRKPVGKGFAPADENEVFFYDHFELWVRGRRLAPRVDSPTPPPAAPPVVEVAAPPFVELFRSLTDEQKHDAMRPYDDRGRETVEFHGGNHRGVLIDRLTEAQIELLQKALKSFLSEPAYEAVLKVANQNSKPGLKSYRLAYYGEPGKEKWACRVADNHLTLVNLDTETGRFGPFLIGAEPANVFQEQEDAAIACFGLLTDAEKEKCVLKGQSGSGAKLGDQGARIGDLSEVARLGATAMLEARIKLLSGPQQARLRKIIEEEGGVENLRLAFFGEMTRRCEDGGRADWKIEGKTLLCDYESFRGHVHMTLRGN